METIIQIEMQEVVIPDHWHTAQECRARAESWENAELKSCLDTVLSTLWDAAGKGANCHTCEIRTGRPPHFYATLTKMMQSLGYRVEIPEKPHAQHTSTKTWKFHW